MKQLITLVLGAAFVACSGSSSQTPSQSLHSDYGNMTADSVRTATSATAVLVSKATGGELAKLEWTAGTPQAKAKAVLTVAVAHGKVQGSMRDADYPRTAPLASLNDFVKSLHDMAPSSAVAGQAGQVKPQENGCGGGCGAGCGCGLGVGTGGNTCRATINCYNQPTYISCGNVSVPCNVWTCDFVHSDCSTSSQSTSSCSCGTGST